jgi:hypothetical protein
MKGIESLAWIPWFITVVGWLVGLQFSRWKSKQEFLAKRCDEISKLVVEISGACTKYHTNSRDQQIEYSISFGFLRVEDRLLQVASSSQGKRKIYSSEWARSLVELRQACTGSHFNDEHNGPIASESHLAAEIQNKAHELTEVAPFA